METDSFATVQKILKVADNSTEAIPTRVSAFVEAARALHSMAATVDCDITKAALIYIAANALANAEVIQTGAHVGGIGMIQKRQYNVANAAVRRNNERTENMVWRTGPNDVSATADLSDAAHEVILQLESKLNNIGFTSTRHVTSTQRRNEMTTLGKRAVHQNDSLSSPLGESFMYLPSKPGEENVFPHVVVANHGAVPVSTERRVVKETAYALPSKGGDDDENEHELKVTAPESDLQALAASLALLDTTHITTSGRGVSDPRGAEALQLSSDESDRNHDQTSKSTDNSPGVRRLLHAMKNLGDENTALLRRVDFLTSLEHENRSLYKEMDVFKKEYALKIQMLRALIVTNHSRSDRSMPKDSEQANRNDISPASVAMEEALTALSVGDCLLIGRDQRERSETDAAAVKALLGRQKQLEITIQALLKRLDLAKSDIEKKEKQISKYESYYHRLRARGGEADTVVPKAADITKAAGDTVIQGTDGAKPVILNSQRVISTTSSTPHRAGSLHYALNHPVPPNSDKEGSTAARSSAAPHSGIPVPAPVSMLQRARHPSTSTLETSLQRQKMHHI